MAQIIEIDAVDGFNDTVMQLTAVGSDTVVVTATIAAAATNRKTAYGGSFSGLTQQDYEVRLFMSVADGGHALSKGIAKVDAADGVFQTYEQPDTSADIAVVKADTETLLGRVTTTVATLWANLTDMITGSGGTAKFTTTALENAPGGGGGGSATLENQELILAAIDTSLVFDLIIAPGSYCNRELIELLFGTNNIQKWANLDEGDITDAEILATIEERVALAILRAEERANQLLRGTRYTLPISPVSTEFASVIAGLAGCYLYEARGALEFEPQTGDTEHQLSFYRKRFESYMREILGGRVRLETQDVPKTVTSTPTIG